MIQWSRASPWPACASCRISGGGWKYWHEFLQRRPPHESWHNVRRGPSCACQAARYCPALGRCQRKLATIAAQEAGNWLLNAPSTRKAAVVASKYSWQQAKRQGDRVRDSVATEGTPRQSPPPRGTALVASTTTRRFTISFSAFTSAKRGRKHALCALSAISSRGRANKSAMSMIVTRLRTV